MASKPYQKSALTQIYAMQRLIYEAFIKPKADKELWAAWVAAWDKLEERKRILQGKALPGEELRATTAGLVNRSIGSRGKLRRLPGFTYQPPQVLDAQPANCGVSTPTGSVREPTPATSTPQATQVSSAQHVEPETNEA